MNTNNKYDDKITCIIITKLYNHVNTNNSSIVSARPHRDAARGVEGVLVSGNDNNDTHNNINVIIIIKMIISIIVIIVL